MVSSDSLLVTVAGSELFGVNRLLAVVVDTLPVTVADKLGSLVDKLELDILVADKLIAASLADDPFITRLMAWVWLASDSTDSKSLVHVTVS
ncbi:hypothetical protein G9A89_007088 [Geosiphon pyriformis]|nr:hypothetical protein G9A89_007088 [Geosiphon pyriformis]